MYEYHAMPFGLADEPACFQPFIQSVLSEYMDLFYFVYIDDILIFSKTWDENTDHVNKVLTKFQNHSIFVSVEKCSLYQHKFMFLGFIISITGLRMDPSKLDTISKWPHPQNIRELYQFLGFTNFYRRFINHFSDVAAPLNALTRDGVNLKLGLQEVSSINSFQRLVKAFYSAPFLLHFNFSKPRVLPVNCSGFSLLIILSQTDNTQRLCLVAYLSRKLTPAEQKWQVHDQELGVIVAGLACGNQHTGSCIF